MKTHHKKCKSKRQKLSSKYNLKKKMREHRRRMKKECKRLGLHKRVRKDPGIPNSWPYKAEMLADLELQKEKKDEAQTEKHRMAKIKEQEHKLQQKKDKLEIKQLKEAAREERKKEDMKKWHLGNFRKTMSQADTLLHVLDCRDPLGCRCEALEAWCQENKKKLIFVLSKSDLVTPETVAKWLMLIGQIAPAVAVSAEAGREGILDLLLLLGHAPNKSPGQQPKAAGCVGVLGYAGTGKRAVCKAMRQELKTASSTAWLLEACRLTPVVTQPTACSAMHRLMIANVPRGAAGATSAKTAVASNVGVTATEGVEPIDVIKELLKRAPLAGILRHFRIPTFEGADEFLKVFCKDRKLKNKKGKWPLPPVIAQRILSELPALPGACCAPPESPIQDGKNYWVIHGDARQLFQSVMENQVKTLGARGVSGPAATALSLAPNLVPGPTVAIKAQIEEGDEVTIPGEDNVSDSCSDDSDMEMDESGEEEYSDLEGEEEEYSEGEESEEEMSMSEDE